VGAASFELHGICRAKIADRKVSPHDGGMTALSQRFRFESGAFRAGADRNDDLSIKRTSIAVTASLS
jgi:hypothetical protein